MNSKFLGSIAIVAGTAIGGGMLALPLATSALGTIPALLLLLAIWGTSIYSSLLMLEINLRTGVGENVHSITGKILGPVGQFVQGASFLSLLYALTMVYLMGGSSLLESRLAHLGIEVAQEYSVLLFTLVFGGLVGFGVNWIAGVSRLLFALMLVLLAVVLTFLAPDVSVSALFSQDAQATVSGDKWSQLMIAAVPITFTSFGFHVCIASIVRYLDGDAVSLRKVLMIGSTIPLICYILWIGVTLGSLSGATVYGFEGSLPKLVAALQALANSSLLKEAIDLFANLALITSFLGVTMSLNDYLAELLNLKDKPFARAKSWVITFVPPFICAMWYPDGFYQVLGYAAVPLVVMILFLPVMMAHKQRKEVHSGYQVCGGNIALAIQLLLGVAIIAAQLA